ncbi:MAG: ABC transporter ATP-binding protein [Gemmatimonadetes bacterium]|jgi:branched-chain amino acid transport system ATP-binding protein|nr:ABC transporter ATP-binding protein [Gemmatimonadota bacterium]
MLLQLDNLKVSYGLTRALRGFSMQVQAGQTVAVLGTNGAGKTTLLKTLSGFPRVASRALEMEVEEGEIQFDGAPVDRLKPDAIVRRGITHVPEGREVFGDLSVDENLWMGAYGRNARNHAVERIYEYFPALAERRRQRAETLSGGEQQMLAIGRALMGQPRLLLLDEPSLGLAPVIVQQIFAILNDVRAEGLTILLVEQNARLALEFADFAYILENGRGVLSGPSAELQRNDMVKEFYLGVTGNAERRSYADAKTYRIRKRWR